MAAETDKSRQLGALLAAVNNLNELVGSVREESHANISTVSSRISNLEGAVAAANAYASALEEKEQAEGWSTKLAPDRPTGVLGSLQFLKNHNDQKSAQEALALYTRDVCRKNQPPSNPKKDNNIIRAAGSQHRRKGFLHRVKNAHWFWTQDDRHMFWGTLPILREEHRYRNALEILTVLFVVFSVSMILVSSYETYEDDPVIVALQVVCVVYFTAEYILRWTACRPHWAVVRPYSRRDFWYAKFKYTISFMALIDLVSILPFYIELLANLAGGSLHNAGSFMVILRVIRILRVFKISRHNQSLLDFIRALKRIGTDLLVFVVLLITFIIMTATAIHYAERDGPAYDDHKWFQNIPDSMYWSIITFTSVGYGDIRPETGLGKVVGGLAALFGVLLMNVPIAFILLSFDEVYKIRRGREERAERVADALFTWLDRHRRKATVKQAKKAAAARRRTSVDVAKSKKLQASAEAKAQRVRNRAKVTVMNLMLNPHTICRIHWGNKNFGPREHYLATKYSVKWLTCVADSKILGSRKMREEAIANHPDLFKRGVVHAAHRFNMFDAKFMRPPQAPSLQDGRPPDPFQAANPKAL